MAVAIDCGFILSLILRNDFRNAMYKKTKVVMNTHNMIRFKTYENPLGQCGELFMK